MFERFDQEEAEIKQGEVLIDNDELRGAIVAGDTVVVETLSGVVSLKGLGTATRKGKELLYVDAKFSTFSNETTRHRRGQLLTGSIVTGGSMTVRNAGGKHSSDKAKGARIYPKESSY